MADEPSAMREEEEENAESIRPEFPKSRVKKIMKLDTDINLVNSEALLLVACAAQLFLEFLAERSAEVTAEKKRKIVKLEHMRVAVKRHRPTSDFLLDELPVPFQPSDHQEIDRSRAGTVAQSSAPAGRDRSRSRKAADKPAPAGSRRIDAFFGNLAKQAAIQTEEAPIETDIAPIGTGEARNATAEALIETDDAPIGTGEAQNAAEEALIETDDAPVGTGEARNATEEALIETDAPSESGEARDETDEGPMESKAASTEIEEAPIESDVASTEAEGSPIETDEIPMEINEISNEVDES